MSSHLNLRITVKRSYFFVLSRGHMRSIFCQFFYFNLYQHLHKLEKKNDTLQIDCSTLLYYSLSTKVQ